MKKALLTCALSSVVAISAITVSHSAMASDFTINPMVGASKNKAMGSNVAVGLEAGYKDFIVGYTYTGETDKRGNNESFGFDDIDGDNEPVWRSFDASVYTTEKYKAHTLYVGYQFAVGAGHLAVKAGADFSKYSASAGFDAKEYNQGGILNKAGMGLEGTSNTEVHPMVGVGYYLDNGLNFNLHYTFQNGSRDMKYSASGYNNNDKGSVNLGRGKSDLENKDFGTWMFTVGYRF
ncbi:hypothetical protein [Shewanella fidelis]|uniref:Outer membrane protein beta-barrel domain-containing protein n=1 Tax=Shewanella fidelis TaxID=173509 RepID=A0AAW8NQU5_9GAMM|nr:hypothetical protein [Shewanella fidelis]MDR8524576.1 hypothetical protein [Shewanella fidelis]MDW4812051.1 hypothetical protein [Shewanella fidelis]MDW4817494.1 hypothetical protein [Shewanella fidelis]MDW4821561.1 hypothetical protein [Shewanella fidelis]MDW4822658.1 hypothetical protein [Shewanella fidelis]